MSLPTATFRPSEPDPQPGGSVVAAVLAAAPAVAALTRPQTHR